MVNIQDVSIFLSNYGKALSVFHFYVELTCCISRTDAALGTEKASFTVQIWLYTYNTQIYGCAEFQNWFSIYIIATSNSAVTSKNAVSANIKYS